MATIEDKTAWEIHTRETRRVRLRSLADSINDTARTARTSLSLFLIVALYLFLTLLSSTDENLLRNSLVELPQVGAGISLKNSYIFAPLIFLYLHAQLLFQLTVLAGKVQTFEVALKEEFPDTVAPNMQEKVEAKRKECWNWLSAFTLVQRLRLPPGKLSKVFVWLGVEAIPVVLLFVLDLSFVRYQSGWITWEHHIIFLLDLVLLAWFNCRVFDGWFRVFWKKLISCFQTLYAWIAKGEGQRRTSGPGRPTPAERRLWEILAKGPEQPGTRAERRLWEILKSVWGVAVFCMVLLLKLTWGTAVFCMALLLLRAAYPPEFDPKTEEEDRLGIWRSAVVEEDRRSEMAEKVRRPAVAEKAQKSTCQMIEEFWQAVWENGENIIDAGPCEWWGLACRYLDVSHKRLVKTQAHEISDQPSDESFATIDLFGRNLLFAYFRKTQLQGANLVRARLQGADLVRAQLQGAGISEAQLQGANLVRARLQGADFVRAQLQGVDLGSARLQGADFASAQLQGVDLGSARLQGASLKNACLQGASLKNACLQGAYLQGTQLQGADLGSAQLQGSFGQPGRQYLAQAPSVSCDFPTDKSSYLNLVWTPGVSYDFPTDKSSYLKKLVPNEKIATVKLLWGKLSSLKEHLQERMEANQSSIDPLPDSSRRPNWETWAKWTAEFACKDVYTARSSLKRWTSEEPLSGLVRDFDAYQLELLKDYAAAREQETGEACLGPRLSDLSSLKYRDFDEAQKLVREALVAARETGEECPGLHSIPDDEWKKITGSWP